MTGCFQGALLRNGTAERVVLKRVKSRVEVSVQHHWTTSSRMRSTLCCPKGL